MNKQSDDFFKRNQAAQIAAAQMQGAAVMPQARKPLTDEQLRKLARDAGIKLMNDEALALGYLPVNIKKFARAIERAHGINEGQKPLT